MLGEARSRRGREAEDSSLIVTTVVLQGEPDISTECSSSGAVQQNPLKNTVQCATLLES